MFGCLWPSVISILRCLYFQTKAISILIHSFDSITKIANIISLRSVNLTVCKVFEEMPARCFALGAIYSIFTVLTKSNIFTSSKSYEEYFMDCICM